MRAWRAHLATLPRRTLMATVRAYRVLLSPWLGNGCRFEPSCSAYSLQALDQYGAVAGTYLTLHRLARCQPFCAGGHDPVPAEAPRLFRYVADGAQRAARGALTSSKPEPKP